MSKIKPKEFNKKHRKKCACYFCECLAPIGFDYYMKKNRATKFIKHKNIFLKELNE